MLKISHRFGFVFNQRKLCKQFIRFQHNKLQYTKLNSRSLIRVTGSETLPFLQGLITNDIQNLQLQPSIFGLFLNQGGRILFDTILYRTSSSDSNIIIECDAHLQQTLIRHLKLYRVRRNVEIEDAGIEYSLWVIWDPSHSHTNTNIPISELEEDNPQNLRLNKRNLGIRDPRLVNLGWRVILPSQDEDIKTEKVSLEKSSEINYRLFLYSLGVGEGEIDFPIGNSFPLESNGDILNGINFHKGCYIGQELTARTHHTGVVRKRLMPFKIGSDVTIPSEVDKSTLQILNQSGRPIAKVRNIVNSLGLALTRVDEALSSTELKLGDHLVSLEIPFWWPSELVKDKRGG